jgi:hypothetical protein
MVGVEENELKPRNAKCSTNKGRTEQGVYQEMRLFLGPRQMGFYWEVNDEGLPEELLGMTSTQP